MATLLVVADPNVCGKASLTRTIWSDDVDIIDPDEIARGMMAGDPGQAAREALRRRQDALSASRSRLVETTLAGSGTRRHMKAARREGYRIVLHYVSVDSPDHALDRIRNRMSGGGLRAPVPISLRPIHSRTWPGSTTTPIPTSRTGKSRS